MQLIGINGFKRSGKGETATSAASVLSKLQVHEVGFADKVKLWAAMSLGLTGTDAELIAMMNEAKESWSIRVGKSEMVPSCYSDDGTAWGSMTLCRDFHYLSGRQYLQHIGNRARHLFGEDFWVDQVLPPAGLTPEAQEAALHAFYPDVDVLIMADLRYENEAQRILDLGGTIWEVIRPGVESDGHDSEQVLPRHMVSWQIINDDGLDVLHQRTLRALAETASC